MAATAYRPSESHREWVTNSKGERVRNTAWDGINSGNTTNKESASKASATGVLKGSRLEIKEQLMQRHAAEISAAANAPASDPFRDSEWVIQEAYTQAESWGDGVSTGELGDQMTPLELARAAEQDIRSEGNHDDPTWREVIRSRRKVKTEYYAGRSKQRFEALEKSDHDHGQLTSTINDNGHLHVQSDQGWSATIVSTEAETADDPRFGKGYITVADDDNGGRLKRSKQLDGHPSDAELFAALDDAVEELQAAKNRRRR